MKVIFKNGEEYEDGKKKTEFEINQEKASRYDKLVSLAKEENQLVSRRRQIGQERCKILGVTFKYGYNKVK